MAATALALDSGEAKKFGKELGIFKTSNSSKNPEWSQNGRSTRNEVNAGPVEEIELCYNSSTAAAFIIYENSKSYDEKL